MLDGILRKTCEFVIPNMLKHGMLEEISGEKGLINEESLEDYDECLVSLIKKWNEIEQYHTKNEPPRNFATFLLREHGIRETRGTQNYIEWVNSLSENEIRADDENWRKCITIHKAISCLKY